MLLLIIISLLSTSHIEHLTVFSHNILKNIQINEDDDDDDDVQQKKKYNFFDLLNKRKRRISRALFKRKSPKRCVVPPGPKVLRTNKISSDNDQLFLVSPLNVNGNLDANSLQLQSKKMLQYDANDNTFLIG
jgi:hypothetical protein